MTSVTSQKWPQWPHQNDHTWRKLTRQTLMTGNSYKSRPLKMTSVTSSKDDLSPEGWWPRWWTSSWGHQPPRLWAWPRSRTSSSIQHSRSSTCSPFHMISSSFYIFFANNVHYSIIYFPFINNFHILTLSLNISHSIYLYISIYLSTLSLSLSLSLNHSISIFLFSKTQKTP